MAKLLDQVLVVDVESTCWRGRPPEGQVSDIIEVGVCVLELASLKRSERHSIMVKPTRSEISEFCTELTSITADDVRDAGTFEDACWQLRRQFRGRQRTWASFGDYDRRQFERCCAAFDVSYPFGPTHFNIKNALAICLGLDAEPSLTEACELMGVTFQGTHHRGGDDAWNAAGVLARLLRRGFRD